MWIDYEEVRIRFFRTNQKKLRSDLYLGLSDALRNHKNASEIGQPVVLSSSCIGGARHMYELYQDSMAIVAKFRKPDLFLTFTCNPQWPEIKQSVIRNKNGKCQKVKYRPDIICRVFERKLDELTADIIERDRNGQGKQSCL